MTNIDNIIFSEFLIDIYNSSFEIMKIVDLIMSNFSIKISIVIIATIVLLLKNTNEIMDYPNLKQTRANTYMFSVYFSILFIFSILYMSISTYTEFIYFNF
jgi:flagellar biosynthesis protein FlhB